MPAVGRSIWFELGVPFLVLVGMVTMDALLPAAVVVTSAFAIAGFVASAMTSPRRTVAVVVAATAAVAVSAAWNHDFETANWWVRLVVTALLGGCALILARIRVRRERALRHMTVVAETVQRALLRMLPDRVGSVRLAARYVSATEAALVGGDLYEVADTPYGVRVLVGDVRGKGLDAVHLASTVLAAFRRAAFLRAGLAKVARDLDRAVTAVSADEDFVTAVLAEFHDDGTACVVNCGHHPPLLIPNPKPATLVDTAEPALPLGLGSKPTTARVGWSAGSRMLLYTDGLVESRDRGGEFFPLVQYADDLRNGGLGDALDGLLGRLGEFTVEHDDDLALVLTECRPA